MNPRSHAYGKKLRDAQNDVLASVGVVERRRSPSEGLPGSYKDRLESLEAEDTVGNAIAVASTLSVNLCTWWVGVLRDRISVSFAYFFLSIAQYVADVPLSRRYLLCASYYLGARHFGHFTTLYWIHSSIRVDFEQSSNDLRGSCSTAY